MSSVKDVIYLIGILDTNNCIDKSAETKVVIKPH